MAWQDMKSQVRPGHGRHQHKNKLILNRLHVMVRKLEIVFVKHNDPNICLPLI